MDSDKDGSLSSAAADKAASTVPADVITHATPFQAALYVTLRSRYFWAMLVYLVTSIALFANDFVGGVNEKNKVYFTFAVIHLVNAAQFAWSWDEKDFLDFELFPEYINVIEAMLYVFSSTLYGHLYTSNDEQAGYTPQYYVCRRLELIASALEVFASVGWIFVWYRMFIEKIGPSLTAVPYRGLSFWDPDFHASWSLVLAAGLYVWYNIKVSKIPGDYEIDRLYLLADGVYVFNSICYMLSTLRDYGWGHVLCNWDSIGDYHDEERMPLKQDSADRSIASATAHLVVHGDDGKMMLRPV